MVRFIKYAVFIALIIIFGFTFVAAHAQADSRMKLHISSVSPIEKPDSMLLRIYFNLYYTQTGKPVLENVVKDAEIALPGRGFTVSPQVKKPDNPIYIVLLLDASGSMVGAAPNLKKAANLALDNIPDNSFFSVVQFDETINLLQDFNDNPYIIRDAIDRQYTPVPYKGTCLYDAAYSAVEQLQRPTSQISTSAGRRSIILFTDGKDENPNGKPCSKHTYAELTNLASKSQVPINPIGLSYKEGAVDELELNNMANSTGGFAAIARNDDQMTAAFANIMNALKSQWMVEASVYPHKGENKATLTLNLANDQTLEDETISIVSSTEYSGPPSPVTASANLIPNAPQQAYNLHLSLTSPELVDHIEISVKDGNAGTMIIKKYSPFTDLTKDNILLLSTQSLTFGSTYQLSIIAFSKKDSAPFAMCTDQNGKIQTECLIPFSFDASFYPSLTLQPAKEDAESNLLLEINVAKPELVGGFKGWLVDENLGNQVLGSDFNIPVTQPIPTELTIPLRTKHIPDGKYMLMVRLLSPNGNEYADIPPTSIEVTYTAPSLVEKFLEGLKANWLISLIILAIIGFMVWFVVKNTKRGKIAVQPPIMAIADDEPILPQGQFSYRSPTKSVTHPAQSATSASEWSAAGPTIIQDESSAQNNVALVSNAQAIQNAQITVLQPVDSAQDSISVNQFPFIIGRIEAHLIIKDRNLSRRHAQITYDDTKREYFLTDLGSSNGTYLDGQRLISNQPIRISSGAIIKLGTNAIVRFDLY